MNPRFCAFTKFQFYIFQKYSQDIRTLASGFIQNQVSILDTMNKSAKWY